MKKLDMFISLGRTFLLLCIYWLVAGSSFAYAAPSYFVFQQVDILSHNSVLFLEETQGTGSRDTRLRLENRTTGTNTVIWNGYMNYIDTDGISPGERFVAIYGSDPVKGSGTFVWDFKNLSSKFYKKTVNCLKFSPDGTRLHCGHHEIQPESYYLLNLEEGTQFPTFARFSFESYSQDGNWAFGKYGRIHTRHGMIVNLKASFMSGKMQAISLDKYFIDREKDCSGKWPSAPIFHFQKNGTGFVFVGYDKDNNGIPALNIQYLYRMNLTDSVVSKVQQVSEGDMTLDLFERRVVGLELGAGNILNLLYNNRKYMPSGLNHECKMEQATVQL